MWAWLSRVCHALVIVVVGLCAVGCDVPDRSQAANVIVVVTATTNEPGPALPVGFDEVLAAANDSRQGNLTLLISRGGRAEPVGQTVPLEVLRDGGDAEHDPELQAEGLTRIASEVGARVAVLASNEPVLDLLTGLTDAARRAPQSTIVVLSSGLQTTGLVDFAGLGWDFDNQTVIDDLREAGFLPDLTGKRVVFVGLGDTAGAAQEPLPQPMRDKLEALWLDVCHASGAQECATAQPASTTPAISTTPARVVHVPVFALPPLPVHGEVRVPVPTEALFAPDSALLLPEADDQLAALATELITRNAAVDLEGHTWKLGPAESARTLSMQRATAVADALIRHGVPAERIGTVSGVGYDELIDPTDAPANRVVVITVRINS